MTLEFFHLGVGTAAAVALGSQEPNEVSTPGSEILHGLSLGGSEQSVLFGDDQRPDLVVEPAQDGGDGVDVPAGDRTRRQRGFELRAWRHRQGRAC